MKAIPSFFLLCAALVAALPAHATIQKDVERTFSVSAAGTLRLETSGGPITVKPGADNTVKITARQRIHADDEEEAQELLKNLELKIEQSGNDVAASAKYTGSRKGFRGFRNWPPVQVEFIATVPASFAAELNTSGGGVTVGDLNGKVHVRTSGGGINLGKLGGPVDARTSGGGITLDEARGQVRLDTSGGPIRVGRVAGPADLSTSGGGIHIETVAEKLRAHTSGGPIHAGIVGPLKADCDLSTSGGGIDVKVDKSAAFHLDAATSGGGVHAKGLTITLSEGNGRSRLSGDVNGGGPELKLRTSGGGIHINVR